jgi:NADH-quinone oxidoreductase subunit E
MDDTRRFDFRRQHYLGAEGRLIPLLQQAQSEDGYLTPDRLRRIHEETGVPLTQVYGVATFYAQFRFKPVGKNLLRVCHGTACHVSGAKDITEAVQELLHVENGETTTDRLFTLETVSCLGCCSLAPVVMINETTHGNLTPAGVKKVLKKYTGGEKA